MSPTSAWSWRGLPYPVPFSVGSPGSTSAWGTSTRPPGLPVFARAKPWQLEPLPLPPKAENRMVEMLSPRVPALAAALRFSSLKCVAVGITWCTLRSTTLTCPPTACATKARDPSSDTTIDRGSRGRATSHWRAMVVLLAS